MPDDSLIQYGVPVFLIGAVVIIALATLVLHLLFPSIKSKRSRGAVSFRSERCPLCQQLLEKAERYGIGLKVCSRCQGIWLSQDQLEQIVMR